MANYSHAKALVCQLSSKHLDCLAFCLNVLMPLSTAFFSFAVSSPSFPLTQPFLEAGRGEILL